MKGTKWSYPLEIAFDSGTWGSFDGKPAAFVIENFGFKGKIITLDEKGWHNTDFNVTAVGSSREKLRILTCYESESVHDRVACRAEPGFSTGTLIPYFLWVRNGTTQAIFPPFAGDIEKLELK